MRGGLARAGLTLVQRNTGEVVREESDIALPGLVVCYASVASAQEGQSDEHHQMDE